MTRISRNNALPMCSIALSKDVFYKTNKLGLFDNIKYSSGISSIRDGSVAENTNVETGSNNCVPAFLKNNTMYKLYTRFISGNPSSFGMNFNVLESYINRDYQQILSRVENGCIIFKSHNSKKINFINAVLGALSNINLPDNQCPEASCLNAMLLKFRQDKNYLSDLKLACNYLLEDRAIKQGGNEFHKIIHQALATFEALESLCILHSDVEFTDNELLTAWRSNGGGQSSTVVSFDRYKKIKEISNIFNKKIIDANDPDPVKPKLVRLGASGLTSLAFGLLTMSGLKVIATALIAALGFVALTVVLPVTVGLAVATVAGVGAYKGYQHHKYNKAEERLNKIRHEQQAVLNEDIQQNLESSLAS